MNIKQGRNIVFILVFIGLILGGCATANTGRQFIPKGIENLEESQLAVIRLSNISNIEVREITIDGEKVIKNLIFITPGNHLLEYKIRGETELWKEMIKNMHDKGLMLMADGWFHDGSGKSSRPVGVPHYGWIAKSIDIKAEAGKLLHILRWDM